MFNRRILSSFVALCAATLSAFAEVGTPALDWPATVDPATGVALPVTVTGNPDYVYADVRQGENKVRVFFTKGAGDAWNGSLPPGRAGTAYARVTAETEDGQKSFTVEQPVPYEETGTAATALTNQRYPNFASWPKSIPSNGVLDDDWLGRKLDRNSVVSQASRLIGSPVTTVPAISAGTAGGLLVTRKPIVDGVGSVWLKAKMANTNRLAGGMISLERITRTSITEVAEIHVPAATEFNEWHQFHVILQCDNPSAAVADQGYFRIRNKTVADSSGTQHTEDASIDVCDLVLTPLIPDVAIYKDAADYSPGYPSVQDPIEFHVTVSNRFEQAPAGHFTPRLVWRQSENAEWSETVMTNRAGRTAQGDGTYACVLTGENGLSDGPFEYFYEVGFSGYTPTFPARRYKSEILNNIVNNRFDWDEVPFLIHTNAWALLTDADENVNESRAPSRKPDFQNAYDSGREPDFSYYGQNFDVVTNTVAWDSRRGRWGWGLEASFDLRNLDEGWPSGEANFVALDGKAAVTEHGALQIPGTYRYLTFLAPEGVRHFRSQYNNLSVVPTDAASNHLDAAYAMQQVGDYTWQAIIHVTNAIDTAFSVTGAYQHAEGWTDYLPGPFEWGQVNQDATAINPPMAGYIARYDEWEDDQAVWALEPQTGIPGVWPKDSTWAPVRTVIDYDGFLMFRYCTTNGSYQIRRAAWQDFNQWQADDNYYSRSFGIYNTKTFRSDLEGRDLTPFEETPFTALEIANEVTVSDEMLESSYMGGVLANNAWVVEDRERRFKGEVESTTQNRAIRLSTWPRVLGSVETTGTTRNDGRDSLSFRVRASSDDDRAAVYTADASTWGNAQNYAVLARTTVASMSEASPSVSILGYYTDERNYWEARFTQWGHPNAEKNWPYYTGIRVQLFKVVDGVATEVYGNWKNMSYPGEWGGSENTSATKPAIMPRKTDGNWQRQKTLTGGDFQLTRSSGWAFVLRLETSSGTVTPTIDVYRNSVLESGTPPANPDWRYTFSAQSGCPTGGTFGFNARDCDATIRPYVFDASETVSYNGSSSTSKKTVSSAGKASWNLGVREVYGYVSPWTVTPESGTIGISTPVSLRRPVPKVYWRLLVCRTGEEVSTDFLAPVPGAFGKDWASSWDLVGLGMDGVWKADSFGWQTVTVPLHFWDDSFLRIQALTDNGAGLHSEGSLVVDDLASYAWRGQEVFDKEYNDERDQTDSWIATYAAIHQDGRTGRDYELSRSRANPVPNTAAGEQEAQSVSTPMLYEGIGDILFNYHAETAPVEFVIEAVDEDGLATQLGASIVATPGEPVATAYRACLRRGVSGRLRVRTLDNGQYGTLYVDNLRATDYPNTGDSSWEVYNTLVSTFKTHPKWKFDGESSIAASYRSAVLNDDPDKDTEGGNVFDDNIPYIQTPAIETGVGEVSFWYRALPEYNAGPARLVLAVANSSAAPDEEWVPLQAKDLNTDPVENPFLEDERANLIAITNIVDDQWRYFSAEFFKQDFRLLRIYSVSEDGVLNRVMLDNVLITEPVRASIDVGEVEFDPGVPLCTQDTGVRVRLVNPRMNPTDIRVFLDWYVADPGAELQPFPIRDVTIDSYERQIQNHTNILINGVSTEVSWISYETIVSTNEAVEITRLPESMTDAATRKWGYESWKDTPSGTLTFTNSPNDTYTFYSTDTIPTDRYPPDTVFQYCVRVLYEGRFKAPVYSETQGQVRNGFWFTNPGWYEPIDLNEAFGTEAQPVAHFWNFTVPTNCTFINEILPDMYYSGMSGSEDAAALRRQFVELMGPEGGDISAWTLHHCGFNVAGVLDPTVVAYTNVMVDGAVFAEANNATTNKGWGFYILGNSGVANRDQELFEDELLIYDATQLLDQEGALTLRRSMGAYADRVAWTTAANAEKWTRLGYAYAGYRRMAQNAAFALQGDAENESGNLDWSLTASFTPGGYNDAEEISLWWLDGTEPDRPDPPEISQPVFTGFTMNEAAGTVLLRFSFASVNGVAVAADDFSWYVETSDSLTFELSSLIEITTPITAPAEPDPPTTVEVTVPISAGGSRFYRIKAFPKGE